MKLKAAIGDLLCLSGGLKWVKRWEPNYFSDPRFSVSHLPPKQPTLCNK